MKTIQIGELYFKPYISEEEISKRVKELGEVILKEYNNNPPILIAVLNGSYVFAADLSRSLNTPAVSPMKFHPANENIRLSRSLSKTGLK